jgi:hypothetical protein
LLKHGERYVQQGLQDYEAKHRGRLLRQLQKNAAALGLQLAPAEQSEREVS